MSFDTEKISEDFLEVSSQQRLEILLLLQQKKSNISSLAKNLKATSPEVHRNVKRLLKNGLIKKDFDGNYSVSIYGKTICSQLPSLEFVSKNQKFFETHNFGNLPQKFVQRLNAFHDTKKIKGMVKVMEKWNDIHNNSEKFIYNILPEIPYSDDIIDIVESKLKDGVQIRSIFAQNTIVPEKRKGVFAKKEFQKWVQEGKLERKMKRSVSVATLLNEKEACVIFPNNENESDMSEIFYGSDSDFHEWCLDFFNFSWNKAGTFQESKLNE